jgi:hypothetical protein
VPRILATVFAMIVGIFAAKPLFNLISISIALPPWPFSWSISSPTSAPPPKVGPNIARTLKGALGGPIVLVEDTVIEGVVNGDVTVGSGVTVEVRGTITGDLYVRPRGKVIILGLVAGAVRNEGGSVAIHGVRSNEN